MNYVEPIKNKEDITRLVKWAFNYKKMYGVIFTLGFSSALRISDILNLTVDDINNTNRINIHEQKTGKRKSFVLKENVAKLIRNWAKNCEHYLFVGKKGAKLDRSAVYRVINRGCQELGIEANIGTHTLRKSFSFHHYRQYKNIALLQKILNHSAESITMKYVGILQEEIDNSYLNLSLDLGLQTV